MSYGGNEVRFLPAAALAFMLVTGIAANLAGAVVVTTQGDYDVATSYQQEYSHWYYGWVYFGRSANGSAGYYTFYPFVFVDRSISFFYGNTGNTENISDGWKKKTVVADPCGGDPEQVLVTWDIQGRIDFDGTMCCDNQHASLGIAKFYVFGNVMLSGLAAGDDKVQGQFEAVEKAGSVGITLGPINCSVSGWASDIATLQGLDPVSNGDTDTVPTGSFIMWRGVAAAWAESNLGAEESYGTVVTKRFAFDLTIND